MTLCSRVDGYQRFGGTYRLHLQGTYKTTRRHNPEDHNRDVSVKFLIQLKLFPLRFVEAALTIPD